MTFAGPTRGPAAGVRRVNANSTMIFYETFRANEVATVSVAGDGDTDFEIQVGVANSNLITCAIGLSDRGLCRLSWHVRSDPNGTSCFDACASSFLNRQDCCSPAMRQAELSHN